MASAASRRAGPAFERGASTPRPTATGPVTRTCPACGTTLAFRPGSGGSHGRSFAHCRGCGRSFTLYGGQVTPV